MELAAGEVLFCATQKVFAAIVVVEVEGVFSFPSVVEYTGGRGSFGGVISVGAPGHVTPGARWWRRSLICGGFEVLLAVEHCDRVRREKQTICEGKIILDVDAHRRERSRRRGESCSVVGGGDGGVPGLAAFCLSSGGPLDVSVFHRMVVARPSSPMTHLLEILMLQRHYTSLLLIADVVGDGAVVVPMFSKCPTILTGVPFWLLGKLSESGG